MAAPSLSTDSQTPLNATKDQTYVRPEPVKGRRGRSWFDRLTTNGILEPEDRLRTNGVSDLEDRLSPSGILDSAKFLNRRALLTWAGIGSIASLIPVIRRLDRRIHGDPYEAVAPWTRRSSRRGTGEGVPGSDPALEAYAHLREVDSWFEDVLADEGDPYYLALLAAWDRAEDALAEARAATPEGVAAKLAHLAYVYAPDAEDELCGSPLAISIVADFAHMLARGPA